MKFQELKIDQNILKALVEVGYEQPTPIQEKAIPPVLDGYDLLGCAQTGTGKTCAFSVPILQRLSKTPAPKNTVRALILTPTRELAMQIYENICQYARYTSRMAAVIFGGVSQVPQVDALRRGADILIATPGRLWDLIGQGHIKLNAVECFVLDEADRMLDMGFFPDVKRIIAHLPEKRQTLLFSATIPKEISKLADSLLHNPVRIAITPSARPVEKIDQQLYFAEKDEKRELLVQLIRQKNVAQALVFTRTKHGADRVARDLNRAGIKSKAIHGDKSQNQRQTALSEFKDCKIAALVATDIAARGIDISELPLVINFEIPNIPETYVHRIGRTGRAGLEGTAISLCDRSERPYLKDIEKLIGRSLPVMGEIASTGGEIPHETAHKTGNTRTRRKPAAEAGWTAEPAVQPVQPRVPRAPREPRVPREPRAPRAPRQTEDATAQQPTRDQPQKPAQQAVRQARGEQQAKAAAPRRPRGPSTGMRGGRRHVEERNEPRFDAHTPARIGALSEAAAARIRKKVETTLATRPQHTDAPVAERKPSAPRRRVVKNPPSK